MSSPAQARFGLGKTFFSPAIDYLLVGGGLSALAVAAVGLFGAGAVTGYSFLPFLFLAVNNAHFGSSTARLYSKPEFADQLPWLRAGLPLVMLVAVLAGLTWVAGIGPHLVSLYLTWSPFHYAAQTYGLVVLYAFRSGWPLETTLRRWLYAACLLPFGYAMLSGLDSRIGLGWFVDPAWVHARPSVEASLGVVGKVLGAAAFLGPLAVLGLQARKNAAPLPLILPMLMLTNALWWVLLPFWHAFVVATVFHSVQYLAMIVAFAQKDQGLERARARPRLAAAARIYGASLALGYGLFCCVPFAFEALGFGFAESATLVSAAINIHHFIVDAFIWKVPRLKPSSPGFSALPSTAH